MNIYLILILIYLVLVNGELDTVFLYFFLNFRQSLKSRLISLAILCLVIVTKMVPLIQPLLPHYVSLQLHSLLLGPLMVSTADQNTSRA